MPAPRLEGAIRQATSPVAMFCLGVLAAAFLRWSGTTDVPALYENVVDRTALVMAGTERRAGEQSVGSGFYVSPHLLVTCAHVVGRERECHVYQDFADEETYVPGRVLHADSLRDVAIVYTRASSAALRLRTRDATIGEPVFALGSPNGQMGTLSSGIVAGLRPNDSRCRTLVQCSSPSGQGASGGPLFDEDGRVIAMTSLVTEQGSFTLGVAAETIGEVLFRVGAAHDFHRDRMPAVLGREVPDGAWAGIRLGDEDLRVLHRREKVAGLVLGADEVPLLWGGLYVVGLFAALIAILAGRRIRWPRSAGGRSVAETSGC